MATYEPPNNNSKESNKPNAENWNSMGSVGSEGAAGREGRPVGKASFRAQMQKAKAGQQEDNRPKSAADGTEVPATQWELFKLNFCGSNMKALVALNFLICFIPLGLCAGLLGWGALSRFSLNFMAMIPLSAILGAATEAVAVHLGDSWGALLNATMGNLIEMVVTVCALQAGLVHVVQMSLIGSVVSNLLLVLGLSFIASSTRVKASEFNADGAGSNISCLVLASLAMTLPTVYNELPGTTEEECVVLSRIIACVMAFVYVAFLVFQFGTHGDYFNHENKGADGERPVDKLKQTTVHPAIAALVLCLSSVAMTVCAQYMVDSIQAMAEIYHVPYAFIGLILLPIMSNAPEHTTAVTAAYDGMMDLAMNVAIGSSTQISLFIVPYAVIAAWIMEVPMSLDFGLFVVTVFILSVFIASGVVGDGNGNWFEGLMLVATYSIVATTTWFVPNAEHADPSLAADLASNDSIFDDNESFNETRRLAVETVVNQVIRPVFQALEMDSLTYI